MRKIIFCGLLSISLISCFNGNNIPSGNNPEEIKLAKSVISSEKENIADLKGAKGGIPTGIRVSLKINLPQKSFNTKAISTDGSFPKTASDVQSYEIFLTGSNLTPISSPIAGGALGLYYADLNSSNMIAGTHTVTFKNVPLGTWFAAVKVFDAPGGTGNNITAPKDYGTDGILQIAVSPNAVTVNPDLTLTPAGGSFSVNPDLLNGKGPAVDVEILPVEGPALPPYGAVISNPPL